MRLRTALVALALAGLVAPVAAQNTWTPQAAGPGAGPQYPPADGSLAAPQASGAYGASGAGANTWGGTGSADRYAPPDLDARLSGAGSVPVAPAQPTAAPTVQPSAQPMVQPTAQPTLQPGALTAAGPPLGVLPSLGTGVVTPVLPGVATGLGIAPYGSAAQAQVPGLYGAPVPGYGYASPGYGYAAPGYGYGAGVPGYGYGTTPYGSSWSNGFPGGTTGWPGSTTGWPGTTSGTPFSGSWPFSGFSPFGFW